MSNVVFFDTNCTKPAKRNRRPAKLVDLDAERHVRSAEFLSYQAIDSAIRVALTTLESGASVRKVRIAIREALDATYSKAG